MYLVSNYIVNVIVSLTAYNIIKKKSLNGKV